MLSLRSILSRYSNNERLLDLHADFVRQQIAESTALSERVKQLACDAWFTVRPVGARRTRMLHLLYDTQTAEGEAGSRGALPLSLAKLEARPATRKSTKRSSPQRNKVLAACRSIVQPQIDKYRANFWASHFAAVELAVANGEAVPKYPRCRLSGKSLRSNATHVDHVKPFVLLVAEWLARLGIDLNGEDAKLPQPKQSRLLSRMALGEDWLDESWAQYHSSHAVLELVYAKANLSKGAKYGEEAT